MWHIFRKLCDHTSCYTPPERPPPLYTHGKAIFQNLAHSSCDISLVRSATTYSYCTLPLSLSPFYNFCGVRSTYSSKTFPNDGKIMELILSYVEKNQSEILKPFTNILVLVSATNSVFNSYFFGYFL